VQIYQKNAILRQMKEYKREKQTLEELLKQVQKKAVYHDDHLRIIDAWFQQMIDEVKLMAGELPVSANEIAKLPSSLYDTDVETFKTHLQERSRNIKDALSRLLAASKSYNPDIVHLQSQLSEKLAAEKVHVVELQRLQSEVEELSEGRDTAVERYMRAEKKLERKLGRAGGSTKSDEVFLGIQKQPSIDNAAIKREETLSNGTFGNDDALVELEEAHHKAIAVSEKQKEQLEHLEIENRKLTSQLTELASKSTQHSDDDYANTELFKQLKSQHDDVINRVNNLEALNIQLQEEAVKLQSERTAFKSQIENESKIALAEREAQLATAEINLARIRSNRDELLADQAIRRSAYEQERASIQKAKDLADASDQRINALEIENERLKLQRVSKNGGSGSLDSLSHEDLLSRHQDLERKHQMLNNELESMQLAFHSVKKTATQKLSELSGFEEKIQRLSAEKAKADQKYFAAMKSKETRDSEIRTLRMQNTKSSDVVSQLKDAEAASRVLLGNLEKTNAEMKDALNSATANQRTTQQHITELNISADGLKAQISELKKLLTSKDSSAATAASSHRKAELEIEELKASLADNKKALDICKTNSLSTSSDVNESFRVSTRTPAVRITRLTLTGTRNLYRLQTQLQRYSNKDLRPRLLQRVCG
jgi:E3 ubiquitin-protein ligase BRE1